jgi:hypothetical protein
MVYDASSASRVSTIPSAVSTFPMLEYRRASG